MALVHTAFVLQWWLWRWSPPLVADVCEDPEVSNLVKHALDDLPNLQVPQRVQVGRGEAAGRALLLGNLEMQKDVDYTSNIIEVPFKVEPSSSAY